MSRRPRVYYSLVAPWLGTTEARLGLLLGFVCAVRGYGQRAVPMKSAGTTRWSRGTVIIMALLTATKPPLRSRVFQ